MANKTITFGADLLPNSTSLEYNLGSADKQWNIFGDLAGTASKLTLKTDATNKLYILGSSTAPTDDGVSVELKANTKLFLSATQHFTAKALAVHDDASTPAEKVCMQWNATDSALEFVFA